MRGEDIATPQRRYSDHTGAVERPAGAPHHFPGRREVDRVAFAQLARMIAAIAEQIDLINGLEKRRRG